MAKKLIVEYNVITQFKRNDGRKHYAILDVYCFKEQIRTYDQCCAHIIYDIPDSIGFNNAADAQIWGEAWLEDENNRKTLYVDD